MDENNEENNTKLDLYLNDKELKVFITKFSLFILVICFSYLFMVSVIPKEELNQNIVQATVEFMKISITVVISFWLGSSLGSKLKG